MANQPTIPPNVPPGRNKALNQGFLTVGYVKGGLGWPAMKESAFQSKEWEWKQSDSDSGALAQGWIMKIISNMEDFPKVPKEKW